MAVMLLQACNPRYPNYAYVSPQDSLLQYTGRFDLAEPGAARFAWSGSAIRAAFYGTSCKILLENHSTLRDRYGDIQRNFYDVRIDGRARLLLETPNDSSLFTLAEGLADTVHTIEIFKRTEASTGLATFRGFMLDSGKSLVPPPPLPERKIEFIGNSITCGYGNEGDSARCKFTPRTENGYMAYGAIAARMLGAQYTGIASSGIGVLRNYNGDTVNTMPAWYSRTYPQNLELQWDFACWQADAVVINLGTNDVAKGLPNEREFKSAYLGLLRQVHQAYPQAVVFCLLSPMITDKYPRGLNRRTAMTEWLQQMVQEFSAETGKKLYFFALTEQGPLGMGCDFHPNLAQHQLNANELAQFIAKKMGWNMATDVAGLLSASKSYEPVQ